MNHNLTMNLNDEVKNKVNESLPMHYMEDTHVNDSNNDLEKQEGHKTDHVTVEKSEYADNQHNEGFDGIEVKQEPASDNEFENHDTLKNSEKDFKFDYYNDMSESLPEDAYSREHCQHRMRLPKEDIIGKNELNDNVNSSDLCVPEMKEDTISEDEFQVKENKNLNSSGLISEHDVNSEIYLADELIKVKEEPISEDEFQDENTNANSTSDVQDSLKDSYTNNSFQDDIFQNDTNDQTDYGYSKKDMEPQAAGDSLMAVKQEPNDEEEYSAARYDMVQTDGSDNISEASMPVFSDSGFDNLDRGSPSQASTKRKHHWSEESECSTNETLEEENDMNTEAYDNMDKSKGQFKDNFSLRIKGNMHRQISTGNKSENNPGDVNSLAKISKKAKKIDSYKDGSASVRRSKRQKFNTFDSCVIKDNMEKKKGKMDGDISLGYGNMKMNSMLVPKNSTEATFEGKSKQLVLDSNTAMKMLDTTSLGGKLGSDEIQSDYMFVNPNTNNVIGKTRKAKIDQKAKDKFCEVVKDLQINVFFCKICGAIFTYNSLLQKHMKKHIGALPFQCNKCHLGFMTQFSHDLHTKTHNPLKIFTCGICEKSFSDRQDLKSHHDSHTFDKKQGLIEKFLKDKAERDAEFEAEKLKRPNLSPMAKLALKSAEDGQDSSGPLGCGMCEFRASDYAALGNHVLWKHLLDKQIFCSVCGMSFYHKDAQEAHSEIHTFAPDGEVKCGICAENCENRIELSLHLDTHPEAKPYMCCMCYGKFISLPQLKNHMESHSISKKFTCPHCNKQFHLESTLNSHLNVHSGEIAYKCDACDKNYRTRDSLRMHLRTHLHLSEADKMQMMEQFDKEHNGKTFNTTVSVETKRNLGAMLGTRRLAPKGERGQFIADTIESASKFAWSFSNLSESQQQDKTASVFANKSAINKRIKDCSPKSESLKMGEKREEIVQKATQTEHSVNSDEVKDSGVSQFSKIQCVFCPKEFGSKYSLKYHLEKKHSHEDFNCKLCGMYLGSALSLYHHNMKQHWKAKVKFKCSRCGKFLSSVSGLNSHLKNMHENTKTMFSCHICDKRFKTQLQTKKHVVDAHGEASVCEGANNKLNIAENTSRSDATGEETTYETPDSMPFTCSLCELTFNDIAMLENHVGIIHFDNKRFVCSICSCRFTREKLLLNHKHEDNKIGTITCWICGKRVHDLELHLDSHIEGKPYKCTVCSDKFVLKHQLEWHIDDCHKIKMVCQNCGKDFENQDFQDKYGNHICFPINNSNHMKLEQEVDSKYNEDSVNQFQNRSDKSAMLDEYMEKGTLESKTNANDALPVPTEQDGFEHLLNEGIVKKEIIDEEYMM